MAAVVVSTRQAATGPFCGCCKNVGVTFSAFTLWRFLYKWRVFLQLSWGRLVLTGTGNEHFSPLEEHFLPGALVKTSLGIEPATWETSEPPLKTPLKALA